MDVNAYVWSPELTLEFHIFFQYPHSYAVLESYPWVNSLWLACLRSSAIASVLKLLITDRIYFQVTETTNNVYNNSLYTYLTAETVPYWIRSVLACRAATSAPQWVQLYSSTFILSLNSSIVIDRESRWR